MCGFSSILIGGCAARYHLRTGQINCSDLGDNKGRITEAVVQAACDAATITVACLGAAPLSTLIGTIVKIVCRMKALKLLIQTTSSGNISSTKSQVLCELEYNDNVENGRDCGDKKSNLMLDDKHTNPAVFHQYP
jgi:hypothetical protein